MAFDDNMRELAMGELENANTDRSVNPAVMVRGIAGRDENGVWRYIAISSQNSRLLISGSLTSTSAPLSADSSRVSAIQGDAGLLRVSSIGGSITTAPLSADSSRISAVQGDANILHVSSVQGDANLMHVSGFSPDAALFRVSSIGGGGGLSANQSISSLGLEGTAHLGSVSAIIDSGSISAKSGDATQFHVSSVQGDAGLQRVSSINDSGSISAKSPDANNLHVSAVQGDAGLFHVSSIVGDANNQHVSAVQGDAGLLHVSAYLGVDTTGTLTTFQTLSVSASQNVKGSAGVLYGYYLFNTDTKPNYVKFFNVSAVANIGTDTPLFTVCLPASAAANVEFPHGIKGFTNGINITATSGRPLDNTALPAASAVGAVLFYN